MPILFLRRKKKTKDNFEFIRNQLKKRTQQIDKRKRVIEILSHLFVAYICFAVWIKPNYSTCIVFDEKDHSRYLRILKRKKTYQYNDQLVLFEENHPIYVVCGKDKDEISVKNKMLHRNNACLFEKIQMQDCHLQMKEDDQWICHGENRVKIINHYEIQGKMVAEIHVFP